MKEKSCHLVDAGILSQGPQHLDGASVGSGGRVGPLTLSPQVEAAMLRCSSARVAGLVPRPEQPGLPLPADAPPFLLPLHLTPVTQIS